MFLVDTNVLSNSTKSKPDLAIRAWMSRQVRIAIPFPVFLEVQIGIAEKRRTNPAKADELARWYERIARADIEYPDMDFNVARLLGTMMCCRPLAHLWNGSKLQSGRRPGQDLFIAAIAVANSYPIATLNTRDFERIHEYFMLPGIYNPSLDHWCVTPGDGPDRILDVA